MINTHSCGARWGGNQASHCASCHRTFGGLRDFEIHRKGLECQDPASRGLVQRPNRHGGVLWGRPGTWKPDGDD